MADIQDDFNELVMDSEALEYFGELSNGLEGLQPAEKERLFIPIILRHVADELIIPEAMLMAFWLGAAWGRRNKKHSRVALGER